MPVLLYYVEIFTRRKFSPISSPTLIGENFYHTNFLSCIIGDCYCIGEKFFCNTKVLGLAKSLSSENFHLYGIYISCSAFHHCQTAMFVVHTIGNYRPTIINLNKLLTMHTHPFLPFLLDIKESDSITVLEQKVASASIEDGITRRTLNLLRHLVAKVLDHKLKTAKQSVNYSKNHSPTFLPPPPLPSCLTW